MNLDLVWNAATRDVPAFLASLEPFIRNALAVGAGYGLALYLVNFYLFTAVFPWFAMARNWVSVFAHIVFGLVAAWVYLRQARPAGT